MKKRYLIIAASLTLLQGCYEPPYHESTRISIGAGYPGADLGLYFSTYPDLAPIPGYPVYYAPGLYSNYFFYDGLYWVYQRDTWYASSWYNGPWNVVSYYDVPAFVLRIPVRYYRLPPAYFRNWHADAPPHWGERWGREWEQRRSGWDRWDRGAAPAPAPLPSYQRNYSNDRYPHAAEQQHAIRAEHYRYQPRDPVTHQYYQPHPQQGQPAQPTQQRQQEQPRPQDSREQNLHRQRDERREPTQQRPLEQPREQIQQRQQEQPRQRDERREDRRESTQQRQPEQPRSQAQAHRPVEQRPQADREQRAKSEPKAKEDKPAQHERAQKDKHAKQKDERQNKRDSDRDQNR